MEYFEALLAGVGTVGIIVGAVIGIVKCGSWVSEVNSDRINYKWYQNELGEKASNAALNYFQSGFERFKDLASTTRAKDYAEILKLRKQQEDTTSRVDTLNAFVKDIFERPTRLENPAPVPAQEQPKASGPVILGKPTAAELAAFDAAFDRYPSSGLVGATVTFVKELPVELS